ncbi:hypothetical protein [Streptomyces sp. NPDC097610]|uniref:hypothetical protein n=1 Tax=Streptomyces sp. NPDC097610 TaxID=3157227 RepID=UPI0033246A91
MVRALKDRCLTRPQAKADPSTLTVEFRHFHRLVDPAAEGVQTWQISHLADGETVGSLRATRGLYWKAHNLRQRMADEQSDHGDVSRVQAGEIGAQRGVVDALLDGGAEARVAEVDPDGQSGSPVAGDAGDDVVRDRALGDQADRVADGGGAQDVEQSGQVCAGGQGVGAGVERQDQFGVVVAVGEELMERVLGRGEDGGLGAGEGERSCR